MERLKADRSFNFAKLLASFGFISLTVRSSAVRMIVQVKAVRRTTKVLATRQLFVLRIEFFLQNKTVVKIRLASVKIINIFGVRSFDAGSNFIILTFTAKAINITFSTWKFLKYKTSFIKLKAFKSSSSDSYSLIDPDTPKSLASPKKLNHESLERFVCDRSQYCLRLTECFEC